MLTLGALAPSQLRARLAGPGLLLRTGPFTVCVHSPIERVAAGLALLYPDYPVPGAGTAGLPPVAPAAAPVPSYPAEVAR